VIDVEQERKEILSRFEEGVEVKASVTSDGLKLFIDVRREVERTGVTVREIVGLLTPSIPEDKIDLGVLTSIVAKLREEIEVTGRRLVKGKAPEPGVDGRILLLAKRFGGKGEVLIDERGYANYAELQLFDNIEKDQVVARLYPPKEGIDGEDVFGKPIPAPTGAEHPVKLDGSLVLEPLGEGGRYQVIRSLKEGYLAQEGETLSVKEELVLKGDLDVRVGNLRFIGKIRIMGDVKPGLEIHAEKGIEISGDVSRSKLVAPNSSISVKGIVHGGNDTEIICGENFTAKAVVSARLEVGGSIEVSQELRDSDVRCLRSVMLPQGQIIGGTTYSVCGIDARRIGNEAHVPTRIVLCSDLEATSEFADFSLKISSHERVRELLKLHLGVYAQKPERIEYLQEPYRKKMQDFLNKLVAVEASIEKLQGDKDEFLASAQISTVSRVNVRELLHPGVMVIAGTKAFSVQEGVEGPKTLAYSYENQAFELRALEEIECQLDNTSNEENDEQRSTDTGA